ncbi:MAG: hypothetical protein ACOY4L_12645 [Pseudomonadota bacterium]
MRAESEWRSEGREHGFSLPIAIFILVVMALLGTAMTRLIAPGSQSVAYEVLSTRAFYAAESGAQWGMNRLFPPGGGGDSCAAASGTQSFSQSGLTGCSATVACTVSAVPTATGSQNYYTLRSTGSCGTGGDMALRVIEVGASN